MNYYPRHDLKKVNELTEEFALITYLDDYFTEFTDEQSNNAKEKRNLISIAKELVIEQYPNLQVTIIRLMLGGMVVTSIPISINTSPAQAPESTANTTEANSSNVY